MKIDAGIIAKDARQAGISAKSLEDAGYDGAFTYEGPHDPFLPIVGAALETEKIHLMTSIAVAFARNPMTLANLGYDLNLLSKGRFILGLGSQIKPHITKRFSMPWSRPAARMKEMILAIQAIWDCWQNGSKLDFRGEFYSHTIMTPFFTPEAHSYGPPKIYVAAVGPLMTKSVAESADGLLVHPFHTLKFMEETTLPGVKEGLENANKNEEDFDFSISVMTATGIDEQSFNNSVNAVRNQIAFYGSTPAYKGVLESCGAGDLQERLNLLSKEGKWADMANLIDDELLNTIAVIAENPKEAAEKIKSRYSGKGDRLTPALYSENPELAPEMLKALKHLI
jgi:probable F420-dependent oxidoreductase